MKQSIVTVTKKGQATIPSALRRKHKIGRRVRVIDTDAGVLLKPIPDPLTEKGSLRKLFPRKNSSELIEEARSVEYSRERGAPSEDSP